MTSERAGTVTVGGIEVKVTRAAKVLFPDDGITKGDLVAYYRSVSQQMLPYLRDRPLVMMRYPDGIDGERLVQKNVPGYFPDWIRRVQVRKQGGTLRQVVCDRSATLVYLANQACIEPHVFLSRAGDLDRPDQLVFDLDPPAVADFDLARRCALALRDLLADELGLGCFVKTTGGKGLHVHVPLRPQAGFDAVRGFARQAAEVLAARHPDWLTTEQRIASRGGRVYADVMRNAYAQTVVAPYAVRARPGAAVATPLSWDELDDSRLRPGQFTSAAMHRRLGGAGKSPWAGLTRRRYTLSGAQRRLDRLEAA